MRRGAAAGLVGLLGLAAACGGVRSGGAPQILFGRDICDRCRMVISEERHSAAARAWGREQRFDDPGCLLSFLAEEPEIEASTVESWVHDESDAWRRAEEAWFAVDPEGGTPMASGILAFGSNEAAAAAAERFGGTPRRWRDLVQARAAGGP